MITVYRNPSVICSNDQIIRNIVGEGKYNIIVAPETTKAMVERLVIDSKIDIDGQSSVKIDSDRLVISSLVKGDVVSFIRLARRILEMTGSLKKGMGDEVLLRNAIYRILLDNSKNLKYLSKFAGRVEYIDMLISLLGDFRRYNINEEVLSDVLEHMDETSENEILINKLKDIKDLMIYLNKFGEEYGLKVVTDTIIEANELLNKIARDRSLLDTKRYAPLKNFLDAGFAVIGFGSVRTLTPQELRFVTLLNALGADMCFYVLGSSSEDNNERIYAAGNEFIDTLTRNISGILVKDINLNAQSNFTDVANDFAHSRENNQDELNEHIHSVSLREADDRVAYICNEIRELTTREINPYRYRDIRIACIDPEMVSRLQSVMKLYGMEGFISDRFILQNTPAFMYTDVLLNLKAHNYKYSLLTKIMKTGLAGVPLETVDLFENYCVKYNLYDGKRIFDEAFYTMEEKYPLTVYSFEEKKVVTAGHYLWENVVKKYLEPLRVFVEEFEKEKSLCKKALKLGKYLDSKREEFLNYIVKQKGKYLDDEKKTAIVLGFKELMSLLAAFTDPMNDVEISTRDFLSLIRIDMRNKSAGTIPIRIDSVEIVNMSQAYSTPCKVLFILGATVENFPYRKNVEGLLDSGELKKFSDNSKVKMPPKSENQTREDFISACLMLGAVREEIYFVNDKSEKKNMACRHYLNYSAEGDKEDCFVMPVTDVVIEPEYDFETNRINPDILKELVDGKMTVSVSAIESYNECPFKYMMSYVLGISKREDNTQVMANSMGSILHDMFEIGVKDIVKEYDSLNKSEIPAKLLEKAKYFRDNPKELQEETEKIFTKYTDASTNPEEKTTEFFQFPGIKARRIYSYALPYILEDAGSKGYVPTTFEERIGIKNEETGKVDSSPLEITSGNNIKFIFNGFIDRIDTKYGPDNNAIERRIIDYKSGSKDIKLDKTYAGLQIQLFAYADVANKKAESEKETGEKEILIPVTDVGYFEIGLSPSKEGVKLSPKTAGLGEEKFKGIVKYVEKEIKSSCNEIAEGRACACPNSKAVDKKFSPCNYCDFRGLCGNSARRPVTVKKKETPERETISYKDSKGEDKTKLESWQSAYLRAMMTDEPSDDGDKKDE